MRSARCLALFAFLLAPACKTAREPLPPPPGPVDFEENLEGEPEQAAFVPGPISSESESLSFEPGWHTAGESVEGRELRYYCHGERGDALFVLASIHGDESAGTPICERLIEELGLEPDWSAERRLVIVPVANPDGYANAVRENANGVDLNRNFPASNFAARPERGAGPLTEPESRFLYTLVSALGPVRALSIHQPADQVDWDGPGGELARELADAASMRAQRMGSRPGSMGSWVGLDLDVAIITLELPGGAQRLESEALWERYGALVRSFVRGV